MNEQAPQPEGLTSDEIALMLGHQLLQLRMNTKQIQVQQKRIAELEAAKVSPIKEAKA